MFRLLYDKNIDGSPLPNCSEQGGMSTYNNIIHYFTNFQIPHKCINISQVENKNLTLYPVEPQEVFDVMNPEKIGFIGSMSKEALELIQNRKTKCFLMIWFPTEGFSLSMYSNLIPKYISKLTSQYNIPSTKVLFVYGDLNIKTTGSYTELFKYLDISNTFGLNIFEHVSVGDYSSQKKVKYQVVNPENRNKNKLFLFKNGVSRPHRMYIITKLSELGLLDKGYYSWINHTGDVYSEDDYMRTFCHYLDDVDQAKKSILHFKENIKKNEPIILDKSPEELSNRDNQIKLNSDFIRDSYFTLVTETVVDNENRGIQFFSEKIYQPIQTLHPFIVHGCQGSLNYLREAGYATFPELFDERYDSIKEENKRANFIINEINKVSKLNRSKLNDIIYSDYMIDKLKHNQNLIQSQPSRNGYYKLMNWLEKIYYNYDI